MVDPAPVGGLLHGRLVRPGRSPRTDPDPEEVVGVTVTDRLVHTPTPRLRRRTLPWGQTRGPQPPETTWKRRGIRIETLGGTSLYPGTRGRYKIPSPTTFY